MDAVARQKPFKSFEVRLVDGRTFTFRTPEQFVVSLSAIHTLDEHGDGLLINLARIASIHLS